MAANGFPVAPVGLPYTQTPVTLTANQAAGTDPILAANPNRQGLKLVVPADPIFGDGVGGGVRKGDDALRTKLNEGIKGVRDSGKYNEIAKKYFDFDVYGAGS